MPNNPTEADNQELVIAPARSEDEDWAVQLMTGSEPWITLGTTREQCLQVYNDPAYLVFIARVFGNPAGMLIMHPKGLASSPYIKSIAVESQQRNKGIGAALMAFAEDYFRKDSKHLFLCVSSFNKHAQDFYKRLGYNKVGEFPDYVIQGASEVLMHKRIK